MSAIVPRIPRSQRTACDNGTQRLAQSSHQFNVAQSFVQVQSHRMCTPNITMLQDVLRCVSVLSGTVRRRAAMDFDACCKLSLTPDASCCDAASYGMLWRKRRNMPHCTQRNATHPFLLSYPVFAF